jgi:hypothetical protein
MPDEKLLNPDQELSDAVRETEFEILEDAFRDKPAEEAEPKAEDAKEEEKPAEDKQEPTRDEQGRFAAKSEPKDEAEPETKTGDQAKGEPEAKADGKDEGESVPRWRLREIAEERRQAQAEAQQLRAELARVQAQQAQPKKEQQRAEEIDPLLDPKGFADRMRAEFNEALTRERLNNNLYNTHMRHGEVFEKAYSALVEQGQKGNAQLVQHLTAQANPGEAIVSWFKQGELYRLTGGDFDKFKENLRAELRKDPEFRKVIVEDIKAESNGSGNNSNSNNTQGVRNIVQLPPSLSRATGSSANSADPIDTDDSDRAVFDYAFKK